MNDETKIETNLSKEEIREAFEKSFQMMKEQSLKVYGTKGEPYVCFVNDFIYKEMQKYFILDENDMYLSICGWVKFINVDKPIKVEVKPYEVKKEDNPFCNTFKKPFYHDLFKQNKEEYSIKVAGKWRKK